jgi:hypothetical protein
VTRNGNNTGKKRLRLVRRPGKAQPAPAQPRVLPAFVGGPGGLWLVTTWCMPGVETYCYPTERAAKAHRCCSCLPHTHHFVRRLEGPEQES